MTIVPDFLYILCAETPLAVSDLVSQRVPFPEQIREHRLHARSGEERRWIILGNQRSARDHRVTLRPEEVEVRLPDLVGTERLHAEAG